LTLSKDWLRRFGWPETLAVCQPIAIAHRGASGHAPENTLAAFQVAADLAAEMWELDIHLSADGVCVVSHNQNLARASGGDLRISDTSWTDIAAVRLADDEPVPRLEQVIDLAMQTGCGLYIELKSAGAGIAVWQLLQQAGFRFACLGSFNVGWIAGLRAAGCEYPLSVLVPIGADPLGYIGDLRVEMLHLCWGRASDAPQRLLTDALIDALHRGGRGIVLWDEVRADVLAVLGGLPVMGICSDRPELLKPYLPDPAHPIDVVCHRGANQLAPENTLAAARICIEQHFQFVELDVRTTSDGALVVMHDATLDRTTDGHGPVADHSLSAIRALDAGGWFRDAARGSRVPELAEELEIARCGGAGLYVEIKQAGAAAVFDMVKAHDMLARCFFWSADIAVLRWLRQQSPDVILMAPRWIFGSVAEAVAAYGAQIVEFDVTKDDLGKLDAELDQCRALGVRSMIFNHGQRWGDSEFCLEHQPDMVNLDRPDRFKIVASYPAVHAHFTAMQRRRADA